MERDEAVLLDLIRAAELTQEFVRGMNEDEFSRDVKTQSATLHQLLVMGEAVKRLSDGFRASHTQIPWAYIAGMRDKLIHGYDMVDMSQVWQTVVRDVPALLKAVVPLSARRE